jgi:hypothetical protein
MISQGSLVVIVIMLVGLSCAAGFDSTRFIGRYKHCGEHRHHGCTHLEIRNDGRFSMSAFGMGTVHGSWKSISTKCIRLEGDPRPVLDDTVVRDRVCYEHDQLLLKADKWIYKLEPEAEPAPGSSSG